MGEIAADFGRLLPLPAVRLVAVGHRRAGRGGRQSLPPFLAPAVPAASRS